MKKQSAMIVLAYNAIILLGFSLVTFFNAFALWLISRYFIHRYGSIMYPQRAHFYGLASFALFAVLSATLHYFTALFMDNYGVKGGMRRLCLATSTAAVCIVTVIVAKQSSLYSGIIGALPVTISFAIGGMLGFRVPREKNPFRNIKIPFSD